MGYSRFDKDQYTTKTRSYEGKSREQVFTSRSLNPALDPKGITVRESRDSAANPRSTPIVIGVDETGSMGYLAEKIIRRDLGVVVQGIYDHKPISDPHVMLAGLGDATCDSAPLQVTQFESEAGPLLDQIQQIWLEGNGGGNGGESYSLLHWFVGSKVRADAIDKHGRKGYLFTIGDESCLPVLRASEIRRFVGDAVESDVPIADLFKRVQQNWHVFHLITPTGATEHQDAITKWRALLGERAIVVKDTSRLAEIIVATIQVTEGQDVDQVANAWGDADGVIRSAVKALPAAAS